jgi:alpha 1,2-mannosyltransferase
MLASNSEVNNVVRAVYELEDRFNRKYNYPWIFLNNEQFSDEFKSYASVLFPHPTIACVRVSCPGARNPSRVSILASGPVYFGQIPQEHWYQPPWIDEAKATEERIKMLNDGIGRSESVPCGFLHIFRRVPAVLTGYRLGIATCADSSLGSDLPSSQLRVDPAMADESA